MLGHTYMFRETVGQTLGQRVKVFGFPVHDMHVGRPRAQGQGDSDIGKVVKVTSSISSCRAHLKNA